MATLDSLPADQRAVLSLVLGRGRSYAQIAALLAIDVDAVSGRALEALDALGPVTPLPRTERALLAHHLLGQASGEADDDARELIADDTLAGEWARSVSAALAPLAPSEPAADEGVASPPAAPATAPADPVPDPEPPAPAPAPAPQATSAPVPQAASAPQAASGPPAKPSSRRGGAAVIAVTVIAIAAVALYLTRHHHTSHPTADHHSVTATNPASATASSTTTSSSAAATARPIAQVNLDPTSSTSSATAIADILQQGSQREIAIIGQDIPANTAHNSYEVWLYNSQGDAVSLGFVNPAVSSDGRLSAAQVLPSDAGRYRELIVTTETAAKPKVPGPILLSGRLSGL